MRTKLVNLTRFRITQKPQTTTANFEPDLQTFATSVANFDILALLQTKSSGTANKDKSLGILEMDNNQELNNHIIESVCKLGPKQSFIGLSWTSQVFRRLRRNIIDPKTYRSSLEQYYKYHQSSKQSSLQICKSFCYLQDAELAHFIKKNQISLAKQLDHSPTMTTTHFQSLINSELFNITDMPMISELLYQTYFPAVGKLRKLEQVHNSLIYLSKFSKIPYFVPQMLLNMLEQKIEAVQKMSFDEFCQTMNVFYLLFFKFPQSLNETNLTVPFWKLLQAFNQKYFAKNSVNDLGNTKISYLQKIEALVQAEKSRIISNRCINIQEYEKKLAQQRQNIKNKECLLYECLGRQMKQILNLQQFYFRQMKGKTDIQLTIKANRLIVMTACAPSSNPELMFSYLNGSNTIQFYQLNKCLPDLLLSTQMALTNIQKNHPKTSFQQHKDIFDKLTNISMTIHKSIEQDLQEIIQKLFTTKKPEEFCSAFYSQQFEQVLWLKNEVQRLSKLQLNYCITDTNLLKFLKNDPRFLVKLTKWNKYHFMHKAIQQTDTIETTIQRNKFGEGLGFKVESKGSKPESKIYIVKSELTKSHTYSTPGIINKSERRPGILNGKPTQLLRILSGLSNKTQ